MDAKPIFVLGQRRPKGLEFVWHLDVLYPDCKNEEAQIISDGAIGSHLQNQLTDFRLITMCIKKNKEDGV